MFDTSINKVSKLDDDLYLIKEANSVNQYLLIGKERAVLIDQGYGYEDPLPIIRQITDLPVAAVATHGDPDHALGMCYFDEGYIHELDYGKLIYNDRGTARRLGMEYRLKKNPELADAFDQQRYLSNTVENTTIHLLRDGDTIDLGGTVLTVLHIPGHSYGHIALVDYARKRMFTGDMVSWHNVWYFLSSDEQAPFSMALNSCEKMLALAKSGSVQTLYSAHNKAPVGTEILQELTDCFAWELAENYQKDQVFHSYLGDAYQHFYGHVNLIYSDDRLGEFLGKKVERQ